jgi:hypothetical protein
MILGKKQGHAPEDCQHYEQQSAGDHADISHWRSLTSFGWHRGKLAAKFFARIKFEVGAVFSSYLHRQDTPDAG